MNDRMMLESSVVFGYFVVWCSRIFYFDVSDAGDMKSLIPTMNSIDYRECIYLFSHLCPIPMKNTIEYHASIYFSNYR